MKGSRMGVLVGLSAVAFLWAVASWGATDAEKCEAKKDKEAGKYAFCRLKADAKAAKKGEAPDYSKCETFYDKWQAIETKYGAECPDAAPDPNALAHFIMDCMGCVADVVSGAVGAVGSCSCGYAPCLDAGGTEIGGACWFLGDPNESCDDVCSENSLSYDSATADYVGDPNGTHERCIEVLDELGTPSVPIGSGGPGGCGCFYCAPCDGGYRYHDTTNSYCKHPAVERACACK